MYKITYDYEDEHNIQEIFEGDWHELQNYIRGMRQDGCYNIDASFIEA